MSDFAVLRLERSTLIVPASNPAMIAKAAATAADAVCLDCEDAVAPDQKSAARGHVVTALREIDFGGKLRLIRINGLDTHYAYRDLIEIVEGAGASLDLIVVPKVGRRDDVSFVATLLDQIEAACGVARPIGIEALIETAAGIHRLAEIAAASPRLEGLIFGSGDYAASLQMPLETIGGLDSHDALYPGHRWHFAMHSIVSAARTYGLRAIDGPFAGIKDPESLRRMAQIARVMGFDGKWCIHPGQIETVNAIFSPAEQEIAWAARVIAAYDAALTAGRGAVSVDGKMIDAANLKTCRHILARAERAGLMTATTRG
ncbi:MAG: CoA ester lyase [Alphaproteobacteria bacterium]|nr:CoA ester lyase [Alphaproteobacteria bacterium]